MITDKRLSIPHKKLIFYSIGFVLGVLGIYVARIIEDQYKNVTGGIVGLALFYLIWIEGRT